MPPPHFALRGERFLPRLHAVGPVTQAGTALGCPRRHDRPALGDRGPVRPGHQVQDLDVVEIEGRGQRERLRREPLATQPLEVEDHHAGAERVEVKAVPGQRRPAQFVRPRRLVAQAVRGGVDDPEAADRCRFQAAGGGDRVPAEIEVGELGDVCSDDGGQRQHDQPRDLGDE